MDEDKDDWAPLLVIGIMLAWAIGFFMGVYRADTTVNNMWEADCVTRGYGYYTPTKEFKWNEDKAEE
jgi:hypothetical protein